MTALFEIQFTSRRTEIPDFIWNQYRKDFHGKTAMLFLNYCTKGIKKEVPILIFKKTDRFLYKAFYLT